MRLNLSSDYALRVLMYVGSNPERLCTIQEIAHYYDISRTHLMKVVNLLGQQGWLTTVRGKGGGLTLHPSALQTRLGAIIQHTEADFQLVECMGSETRCRLSPNCQLKGVLYEAKRAFFDVLNSYTLNDLLQHPTLAMLYQEPASVL